MTRHDRQPFRSKAGFVVGKACGKSHVYEQGKYIGDVDMTQTTVGFQIGGSVFSPVVFFQVQHALSGLTNGNFEFGTEVSAIALTAKAGAAAKLYLQSTSIFCFAKSSAS